jgi:hypothetical protein
MWSRTALVSSAFVSLAEIDERDPDIAAAIDNVVEGFEIFFLAIELGRGWWSCESEPRDMSYVALRYVVGSETIHRQEGELQTTEI